MKNIRKNFLVFLLVNVIILAVLPTFSWANSAEPPAIVILVNNPPKDLSIVLVTDENKIESSISKAGWEGYYSFYSGDIYKGEELIFKISTNESNYEIIWDQPLSGFHNVFTLDLSDGTFIQGKYPFRSVILVGLRLILTLFIEAIIFWSFGFRNKKSWIIFLVINLFTQGALNIWLNSGNALMPSYFILTLIFGEIFVFAAEMMAFPILVKEKVEASILTYVFVANFISLIAGGYIISSLPV